MDNAKNFFKGFLFSLVLFSLYFFILPNLFAIILRNQIISDNFWISNLAYLAVYLGTFIIILLIIRKDIWKQFKEFIKEPKKFLSKGCTYWMYGLILMIVSNLVVTSLVHNIAVNEQATREVIFAKPLYAIPTIIIIGPVLEEVIFRFGFKKAFNKEIPYALFSAFIFGLLHVLTAIDNYTIANILAHASEFLYIIPYGSLGFFFAKAYYETDNIFSTIVPHILHNTLSVALILVSNFLV